MASNGSIKVILKVLQWAEFQLISPLNAAPQSKGACQHFVNGDGSGLKQMWEWKNGMINKAANPRTPVAYLPAINTWLRPSDFTCQWQEVEVLAGETAGSVSEQRRVISERLFRRVTGQSNPEWTPLSASVHTWHKNVA